ncbi:hypothetical protein EDB84DRAFT_1446209, partial [Lactarius hengduanensis]
MSSRGRAKVAPVAKPSGTTKTKCPIKQGKKLAATPKADGDTHEKVSRVQWDDTHSSQDMKKENRPHHVAKDSKSAFHIKMAEYIFSVNADPNVRKEVKEDTKKYSKAVENRITQADSILKFEVQKFGGDENLSNILETLLSNFPVWECLHGFWHTLPSFNPHEVSSEPRQDLESDAAGVLFGNQDKGEDANGVGGGVGKVEPDGLC